MSLLFNHDYTLALAEKHQTLISLQTPSSELGTKPSRPFKRTHQSLKIAYWGEDNLFPQNVYREGSDLSGHRGSGISNDGDSVSAFTTQTTLRRNDGMR